MLKLNLGCGENWRNYPDYIGLDIKDYGQKHVVDVREFLCGGIPKIQFVNQSDEIMANHFLEHFNQDELKNVFNGVWEMLKYGGVFRFVVPHKDREEDNERRSKSWGGLGIWGNVGDEYWEPLGIDDELELNVMRTEDYIGMSEEKFDLIFIDGDHSYEGVKKDYELLWPRLNEGGLMIFHDVLVDKDTEWGMCGVKRFWDELDKKEYLVIGFSAGMGIIKK